MSIYQRQIDRTHALLRAKGRSVTLRDVTIDEEGVEPLADTPLTNDVVEVEGVPALVSSTSAKTEHRFTNEFANGTLVRARARDLLVAAKGLTFVPAEGDEVVFDEFTWVVIGVDSLAPDGTPIFYKMTVKR